MSNTLEFKSAQEFWDEAKEEAGYGWMGTLVEAPGSDTAYVLNNEHNNKCFDLSLEISRFRQHQQEGITR